MPKLQEKKLMLRTLLIGTLLVLSSCQSIPKPPVGETCIIDVANVDADCATIQASIKAQGDIRGMRAATNEVIPLSAMDNYVCFSPQTWGNIQTYINELKQIAKTNCSQ
jgi:hypothetical protein